MIIQKRLQKVGEYSFAVVIPKIWLAEHGNPSEVELQMGRTRILLIPVTTNTKRKRESADNAQRYKPKMW